MRNILCVDATFKLKHGLLLFILRRRSLLPGLVCLLAGGQFLAAEEDRLEQINVIL